MTIKEILEKHPKGKEFGHLVEEMREIPIFIDSAGEVLSIPPIINSNFTGKISEETKEVFIECSGFDFKFMMPALNVLAAALVDRGAKVESVKVVYPEKIIYTPDMTPKKISVDVNLVNEVSGLGPQTSWAAPSGSKKNHKPSATTTHTAYTRSSRSTSRSSWMSIQRTCGPVSTM